MKVICSKRKAGGFNFIDLLIVVVTVLLFVSVALPWLVRPRPVGKGPRTSCVSNLKHVGLAFRMWANDNSGNFPMAVSTNKGGTLEYNETGQVFRQFVALSNELNTPKILVCPEDNKRTRAMNWTPGFNNLNISYFVGLDADETKPQTILSGDRNVTGGILTNGNVMLCKSNTVAAWTSAIHNKVGNIGLGDGSVFQASEQGTLSLQRQLQMGFESITNQVIRLAIP